MQTRPLAYAAAVAALLATLPLHAVAPDAATLQKEIQALEATVRDLESRISQLEGRTEGSSQHASTEADAPSSGAPSVTTATAVTAAASAVTAAAQAPTATAPTAAVTTDSKTSRADATVPVIAAGSGYVSPEAALRLNWAKVTAGMDREEVSALLGAPSVKSTLDGRTVWYYAYPGTGRGSVFFTDAGKVSSRQSPFGLGW